MLHSSWNFISHFRFQTHTTIWAISWHMRPAKTQISLGIHPDWPESSLSALWVAKDRSFLHADSEDSDQTGRMPRLNWVFAGCTCRFVGFVMRRLILILVKFLCILGYMKLDTKSVEGARDQTFWRIAIIIVLSRKAVRMCYIYKTFDEGTTKDSI